MEQTIKNMSLIIFNVKKELETGNYNESKTLMNTYRTLLKRFTFLSYSDKRIDDHRIMLESHKDQLLNLHQQVEQNVESTIIKGEYKKADTLVEVSWRLETAASDIQFMISKREKYVKDFNRSTILDLQHQNRTATFTGNYNSEGKPIYESK